MGQFVWQLCPIVIHYRWLPQVSSFLGSKGRVQSFRWISKKTDGLICAYTDRLTGIAKSALIVPLIICICTYIPMYFIGSPMFPIGCYKLRGKLNIPY